MHGRRELTSLVVVLGLWAAGCGADDSLTSEGQSRIVGGSSVSDLPAVGAITRNGNMHCTGTLVGPRTVVTAAHCVKGYSAPSLSFVVGSSLGGAQAMIKVVAAQAHPSYSASSLQNDIGVLTLAQDAPVQPMTRVASMSSALVGTRLYFVGYGISDGYSNSGSGIKRGVWITLTKVSSTSFSYGESGRNTCSGDSGGPAFVVDASGQMALAGVTSYGDQYCTSYGVDTRMDAYLGFVGISGTGSTGSTGSTTPADPCNGETYVGRCSGGQVIWCESSQMYTQDCAAAGKTCTFDASHGYYGCAAVAQPVDPCNGETYAGRCSGNTVVWCESQTIQQQRCSSTGRTCAWVANKGYYGCV